MKIRFILGKFLLSIEFSCRTARTLGASDNCFFRTFELLNSKELQAYYASYCDLTQYNHYSTMHNFEVQSVHNITGWSFSFFTLDKLGCQQLFLLNRALEMYANFSHYWPNICSYYLMILNISLVLTPQHLIHILMTCFNRILITDFQ